MDERSKSQTDDHTISATLDQNAFQGRSSKLTTFFLVDNIENELDLMKYLIIHVKFQIFKLNVGNF